MKKTKLISSLLILFSFACEKEEIPIKPHDSGSIIEQQVAMEQDYRNQLFFDFETNRVVSSNLKTEWDLGFESSSEGFHLFLNSAKGMAVHQSTLSFEELISEEELEWRWDAPSGNPDSTAIGDWITDDYLYLIDRGYAHTGEHQGYYKLNLISGNEHEYFFQYGELSETNSTPFTLTKAEFHSLTYFSFESGVVTIAPEDDQWDLMFTQYIHLFSDPPSQYIVSGVLLNRYETSAIITTDLEFSEITFEDAQNAALSYDLNTIGYDWKWYDFDAGAYTVNSSLTYLVRTSEGYFYEMRFTDFYNEVGEKGFPKFEFQQL